MRRAAVTAAIIVALMVVAPNPASAHPLGNFTINIASVIDVRDEVLLVTYVVDMAEIPAFQERNALDANRDERIDALERDTYADHACAGLAEGIEIRGDGEAAALRARGSRVSFPPGQAGLDTLRLRCTFEASTRAVVIDYRDRNYGARAGWHEISASGSALAGADVPTRSPSALLTAYPQDRLGAPLDIRTAQIRRGPGPNAETVPRGPVVGGPVSRAAEPFAALVARRDGTILALLIAIVLGALHALAPGHGKVAMAASLVAARGTAWHAATLGVTVTVAHTVGVLVLGAALAGSTTFAPERLYPWLGMAGGAMVAAFGATMLRARHRHTHPPTRRGMLTLGVAGGLTPSPSAILVMIAAIATGRLWFGVALVGAYGLGMACTLTGIGITLARARGLLERAHAGTRLARVVPVLSAWVVIAAGLVLIARGAVQA